LWLTDQYLIQHLSLVGLPEIDHQNIVDLPEKSENLLGCPPIIKTTEASKIINFKFGGNNRTKHFVSLRNLMKYLSILFL
jgi:hypothetical protein